MKLIFYSFNFYNKITKLMQFNDLIILHFIFFQVEFRLLIKNSNIQYFFVNRY